MNLFWSNTNNWSFSISETNSLQTWFWESLIQSLACFKILDFDGIVSATTKLDKNKNFRKKIAIPAKRVPTFSAGKLFKDRVQG